MKYLNDCYNRLIELIEENPNDWQSILKQKPYSLKSIKQSFYNENWYMLVYNLFESNLVNPIVKACRGTVVDISNPKDVKIICAPYLKFCNLGEFPDEDKKIDWKSVWISEKIDGILIKAAKYKGEFYWFTNGSFDLNAPTMDISDKYIEKETDNCKTFYDLLEYAIKKIGNCNIKKCEKDGESTIITYGGWCDNFMDGDTLCFELVSPKNKIICDYPETELYWHGFRDNSLKEHKAINLIEATNFNNNYEHMDIKVPKIFDLNNPSAEAIKAITDSFDGSEEEGVVICDNKWHRAKIKSKDYLKHKFLRDSESISEKDIFKYILSEEIDDITNESNKNKIDEVKGKINFFCFLYQEFSKYILNIYNKLNNDRKSFALFVNKDLKDLSHLAFKVIDEINSEKIINVCYYNYSKFEKDFCNLSMFIHNLKTEGELSGRI